MDDFRCIAIAAPVFPWARRSLHRGDATMLILAVVASFPEAICNLPVVLFAWGPALAVVVSACAMHRHIKRRL